MAWCKTNITPGVQGSTEKLLYFVDVVADLKKQTFLIKQLVLIFKKFKNIHSHL